VLPETILQFGAGNFLRAFADLFVHQANQQGQNVGRIVVVQSTGDARANRLNQQSGRYHVLVRGLRAGQVIDEVEECASISRSLVAATQWNDVLQAARSPELRYILSNTTEAGYDLDPRDDADSSPPRSFPAKLMHVLRERWQARQAPLTLLPCELHEDNARKLRAIILHLAEQWKYPAEFREWVGGSCHWLCSLVDRIVPGTPESHPLLATDPLAIMAEPFAFWALENNPAADPWIRHPAIVRTDDVQPYFLRKVRILNGAHTALLCHVGLNRFATVLDAMNDPPTATWLESLLFEEIVPVLEQRCDDPLGFARQTLERFRNPFLKHKLADIALHHATKKAIRLEPTMREFIAKYKKEPPRLSAALRNDRLGQ
jgi:tagaturonate reductase